MLEFTLQKGRCLKHVQSSILNLIGSPQPSEPGPFGLPVPRTTYLLLPMLGVSIFEHTHTHTHTPPTTTPPHRHPHPHTPHPYTPPHPHPLPPPDTQTPRHPDRHPPPHTNIHIHIGSQKKADEKQQRHPFGEPLYVQARDAPTLSKGQNGLKPQGCLQLFF